MAVVRGDKVGVFSITLAIVGLAARLHVSCSDSPSDWQSGVATWYGSSNGDGSDGGACGFQTLSTSPYGYDVAAGSPMIFSDGEGCGACYQVKCLIGSLCSSNPVTVVITDECPGCESAHFDLSGSAFAAMASAPTLSSNLLDAGLVQMLYKRVPCNYPGEPLSFQINQGATSYWFSVLIKYVDGDGEIAKVEVMQDGYNSGGEWQQMEKLWGGYWCLNGGPVQGPFSFRLTASSGTIFTSINTVPANWSPGAIYTTNGNF